MLWPICYKCYYPLINNWITLAKKDIRWRLFSGKTKWANGMWDLHSWLISRDGFMGAGETMVFALKFTPFITPSQHTKTSFTERKGNLSMVHVLRMFWIHFQGTYKLLCFAWKRISAYLNSANINKEHFSEHRVIQLYRVSFRNRKSSSVKNKRKRQFSLISLPFWNPLQGLYVFPKSASESHCISKYHWISK